MAERGANNGADACCSSAADHHHDSTAAAHLSARASRLEQELEDDPTLQDCCRRDLEQEAKASRQQAALSRVDRASKAELARKLGGAVVPPPPLGVGEEEDPENGDFDASDDDDESLAKLRDLRLSQLRQEQERKEKKKKQSEEASNGNSSGRLSEIKVSRVFSLAASLSLGTRKSESPFVVHLADAGSSAGASLDELLETLAGDFRGSGFARAAPSKKSTEVRASVLVAVSISPAAAREGAGGALAVFRGGALVAAVPVSGFCSGEGGGGGGGGELVEESVVSWLRRSRALAKEERAEGAWKRKEGDAPSSSDDRDSDAADADDADDADPCKVCGRTYFHTHVRPVRGGGNGNGAESDGEEGDESGSE